jgi:site-specific DNA-methyltransferase (adenine-specific)
MPTVELRHGDCIEVMATLPDNSIDSIVTDPPYGLEFMGKEWDAPWKQTGAVIKDPATERGGFQDGAGGNPYSRSRIEYGRGGDASYGFQLWFTEVATEALRVLKPGGHLLAFGGTRTYHRLAVAIEDAGFEIRDSMMWLYGSGFPKSHDVSKAIDKAAGAKREIVGKKMGATPNTGLYEAGFGVNEGRYIGVTAPATDSAKQWHGWGTALKPAHEPIVVARKPLIGTVAENVLEWGVGAMNIDGCRIGYASDADKDKALAGDAFKRKDTNDKGWSRPWMQDAERVAQLNVEAKQRAQTGRWPANVVLSHTIFCDDICADGCPVAELDRQSGINKSTAGGKSGSNAYPRSWTEDNKDRFRAGHTDTGGASRFFYVAKASKKERPNVAGVAHPTVKPLALMQWLVRLVTPAGGTVLEPFAGSGTTVEAALLEGCNVLAIEKTEDYLPLINARIERVANAR